jgi:phosphoribosyl-ATP pyrophosphohydrolase
MSDILNDLYIILRQRRDADPESSYVASLYKKGTKKITEKVIEEAEETIAEALKGDKDRLKEESADLLFHLMVLWAEQGVSPDEVFTVLEGRFGTSGHAEKASRKK